MSSIFRITASPTPASSRCSRPCLPSVSSTSWATQSSQQSPIPGAGELVTALSTRRHPHVGLNTACSILLTHVLCCSPHALLCTHMHVRARKGGEAGLRSPQRGRAGGRRRPRAPGRSYRKHVVARLDRLTFLDEWPVRVQPPRTRAHARAHTRTHAHTRARARTHTHTRSTLMERANAD